MSLTHKPRLAEDEIFQRHRELETVNRIVTATATGRDLPTVLNRALAGALEVTGLEGGTLCLVNPERNSLDLAASINTSPETIQDLTTNLIKIGDCLCGNCAQACKPLILWDNASDSEFATREATRNEGIRFHAAFPLLVKDRCIGVLCVFAKSDAKPTERSLKLVEDLCGPIALAVENARLFETANQELAARKEAETDRDRLFNLSLDMLCITGLDGFFKQLNPAWSQTLNWSDAELLREPWLEFVHPDDRDGTEQAMAQLAAGRPVLGFENRYRCKDGSYRWISWNTFPLPAEGVAFAVARDITARKQAEALVNGQNQILEKIALGTLLRETLDALLRFLESQSPDMLCSILLLDADGTHVRHGAAPSLPVEFNRAIDGQAIGPRAGSCGTAAFRREPVFVEDIATDPLWTDYRDAALPHGLRACWSTPIFDAQRRMLGTFAIYYRQPGLPTARHLRLIELATATAAIAIGKHREETALRESEERLRLVMDGLGTQMFVGLLDIEGVVLLANRPALEAAGLRMEDVLGQPVHETYWLTYSDAVAQRFRAAVQRSAQGETIRYDEQIRFAEGQLIWVAFTVQPVRDESGKIVFLVPSAVVIHDRKQAEVALRESEEHFRSLFEQASDGISVSDAQSRFLDVNTAGCELMGYARDEMLRLRISDMLVPDEIPRLAVLMAGLAGGNVVRSEWRFRRKDGSTFTGEVAARQLPDGRLQAILRDLTERQRAEAALRESEERLRLALDAAHMGTFDWDVPGDRITWSRWHEELWGFKPGEFGGTYGAFSERVHPEDVPGINAEVARCIAARAPFTHEFRVVWPDGSVHWVMGQGEFTFGADGQPVRMRGTVVETTARKRAEEQLREVQRQLQEAQDEERRRIARDLHDSTAQKLAAATMNLGALDATLTRAAGQRKLFDDSLRLVEEAAQEIRTLSHVLHPPLLGDLGLLGALRTYVEGFAQRSGLEVAFDAPAEFPALHHEIEVTLFRVTQEALGNVHRHSGSRMARVRLASASGRVSLEVRDQGRGAPPEKFKGAAGVGLASMRARLGLLGGQLMIDSGPRGTTLKATVPLKGTTS